MRLTEDEINQLTIGELVGAENLEKIRKEADGDDLKFLHLLTEAINKNREELRKTKIEGKPRRRMRLGTNE